MFAYCCCDPCPEINVTRWLNITQVRKSDGEVITNVDPFARLDPETAAQDHDDGGWCGEQPPGTCGRWLIGGGNNAVSEQLVTDTVNDILDCAETLRDHNCYEADGTITRTRGKRGGKWVLGKKSWHGTLGYLDYEKNTDVDESAPQAKYLTMTHTTTEWSQANYSISHIDYTAYGFNPPGTYIVDEARKYGSVVRSVDRYSGVITQSGADMRSVDTSYNHIPVAYDTGSQTLKGVSGDGAATSTTTPCEADGGLQDDTTFFPYGTNDIPGLASWSTVIASAVDAGATEPVNTPSGWSINHEWTEGAIPDLWKFRLAITVSRTNTGYSWSCLYETIYEQYILEDEEYVLQVSSKSVTKYIGSKTLSNDYTAAECYTDLKAAMAAWNISDDGLYVHRLDEQLANGPLCCYDETSPTSPIGFDCPMYDYDTGLVEDSEGRATSHVDYVITWATRAWIDPRNYLWLYPNGSYLMPDGFESGAELVTPLYTGSIIAHNPPGSERHFWFGFEGYRREEQLSAGVPTGMYIWVRETFGAFSSSPLPDATLRWMGREEAQYDGLAFTNNIGPPMGNMPQAFLKQRDGVLVGGKYVECKEQWPRIDFSRPNGADKYAVDQTTACCVLSTGTGTYTVKKSVDAIDPLDAGGLAIGNTIIISGDGVYPITDITDDGTVDDGLGHEWHQFTIEVGTKIDDLPTGGVVFGDARDEVDWLGRARWWSTPGIAGRVAITTSHDGTTLTVTPTAAQLHLRSGASVDLCNASMTVLATVTLTRTNDTTFTVVAGAQPTAAYMVAHLLYDGTTEGIDAWQLHNASSQHTYVHLTWQRQLRIPTVEPEWYEGQQGILSVSATQGAIAPNDCYGASIAITPSGEVFGNADVFGFPGSFSFDDYFGAVWQGVVETTMVDPFWQAPFKPDCEILSPDTLTWHPDDGSGQEDYEIGEGSIGYHKFYAYPPLVEALKTVPSGAPALPSGVVLGLDPELNIINPPHPMGVPLGDGGAWTDVWRPWGFAVIARTNILAAGRFSAHYDTFVPDEV